MNTNCDAIAGSDKFEQEISMDTVFVFPEPLTEHDILGQHLIIAPENANWLVCDDDAYKAFSFFKAGNSIQEVEDCLCKQGIDSSTASEVVSQLIAQILGKDFLQQATVIEKEAFKSVSILLTAGCNLRCSTCFLSATVAGPDECTYADWKRFLKAFAKMGGEEVVLTGGEPTMNPDCGNIIAFAKSLGLNVILATNGNLINAENAHIFGNNCNEIRISIDGPNEETHDSVRGKGTFKKAVGALKALSVYADCQLTIPMTPTLVTLPVFRAELHQFVQWARKNIREDINILVAQKLMAGRNVPGLSRSDEKLFRKHIQSLCAEQVDRDYVEKLDAACVIPNRRILSCGVGEQLTIKANGDMMICEYSLAPVGNVKNIGEDDAYILDVVDSSKKQFAPLGVRQLSPCQQCDLHYFCGGKCRVHNKQDFGDPNTCNCNGEEKNIWYERLVRISPYIVQPLTD